MNNILSKKTIDFLIIITTLLGSILFSGQKANAVTFNFTQDGWTEGGTLTGSFSGEDGNGDGVIEETEVTDYSISWSGNSLVPSFKQGLSNLYTWQFSLVDQRLINGFSSQATTFWSYDDKVNEGIIGIGAFAGTIADTTLEPPVFSVVPEPLTILGTGTALLFGSVFKQKLRKK